MFRRLAPLALLAFSTTPALAQDCTGRPSATRLFVTVSGVRAAQGLIAVTLYADDSSRFLARRGSLYVGRVPARAGVTRVCIHVPAPGIYGLAVYHDANADRRFDRTMIGLPAEGYGFSNDAPTLFGLPRFRSVRLAVPRDGFHTSVRLRYP
ncbi:DUF2141 domain-containing protein [Sphingosinicella sp.]|uniref:DUF2141 domain-containing protein n=1 Tax=Sphingosinicella sp. TaxID=1917971 RepID=UPI0040377A4F